jgi:pyrroline-5-carboxylate reductase
MSDRVTAKKLLSAFGRVLELPERQFDAVTSLSGSGPAFFAYLLDKMTEAAVKEGLKRNDALLLAEQTMKGTARLLMEKSITPKELVDSVSSAKGTTVAGLAVLKRSKIGDILQRTLHAATERSKELSF